MKKLLVLILILAFTQTAYGAVQWLEDQPAGTASVSDIDTLIAVNNDALDRLALKYRRGLSVLASSATQVSVLAGEVAIPNAAATTVKWRGNTATTTVTWADIDTGAEAVSTYYYVYVEGDTDETTCGFVISTSSSAPTGYTYYRKVGWFYNDASGNIVDVGNIKDSDAPNIVTVLGTDDITTTSTSFVDMTDMVVYFVSNGRPVTIQFTAPLWYVSSSSSPTGYVILDIDGTDAGPTSVIDRTHDTDATNDRSSQGAIVYLNTLTAGEHTIKVQWKTSANTLSQRGSTDGNRSLVVTEN